MENRKTKIISVVAVVALALTVITATYAYFQAQVGEGKTADITVKSYTVDTFTFATGSAISFSLDQENFASGAGNISGSTYASAMLTANNKTNTATEHYYLYLNIEDNTFTYSINESTPEIIMTITDSAGNEVTDITTLAHTSVTDASGATISGYDITNKNGLITLFNNREITTTSSKEERWNIKVTFVNYDASQNANAGKSMSAKVMIQKEKLVQTMANVCKNGQTLSSCVIAMDGIDETLYHHTSTLTNGANDNSYRYAGGGKDFYTCTYNGKNVSIIGNSHNDVNSECKTIYQAKLADGSIQYFSNEYGKQSLGLDFSDPEQYDSIEMSWNEKANSCYDEKNDIDFTDINDEPLTKELCTGKSYNEYGGISSIHGGVVNKIEQKEINNYVCFGSTASPCPTDNLYRIIGVFGNQVKLIKYDYATSALLGTDGDYQGTGTPNAPYYNGSLTTIDKYYWNNSTSTNTWSESLLNKTNLNINFINNIGTEWAQKIATTTWKVGGNTYANIVEATPSVAYQNEIVSPASTNTTTGETEYTAKIGLMYASDYGFAAAPSAWTANLETYNGEAIKNLNWMYMGLYEWTISRVAGDSNGAFRVLNIGFVDGNYVSDNNGVRPSFNLLSSTTYVSGSGSASDPMVIN